MTDPVVDSVVDPVVDAVVDVGLDPAFVENPTVEVAGVSKWFGTKVAVSDVSCSFEPGITGILGRTVPARPRSSG